MKNKFLSNGFCMLFFNSKDLDLCGNVQVIKRNLKDWLKKGGFKHLRSLSLEKTDITENELAQIIETTEWFRKLRGLNFINLIKFLSNIRRLTHLDDHGVSYREISRGRVIHYFYGSGLFCIKCKYLRATAALINLALEGKVHGKADGETLNIKFFIGDLNRAYRRFSLPLPTFSA
jgi:hypothetical protein